MIVLSETVRWFVQGESVAHPSALCLNQYTTNIYEVYSLSVPQNKKRLVAALVDPVTSVLLWHTCPLEAAAHQNDKLASEHIFPAVHTGGVQLRSNVLHSCLLQDAYADIQKKRGEDDSLLHAQLDHEQRTR